MRAIDHPFRALHSELIQRCLDAAFSADFPVEGRFVTAMSRGRRHWYFDMPDGTGGKRRRNVWLADDAEIARLVDDFRAVSRPRSGAGDRVEGLARRSGNSANVFTRPERDPTSPGRGLPSGPRA